MKKIAKKITALMLMLSVSAVSSAAYAASVYEKYKNDVLTEYDYTDGKTGFQNSQVTEVKDSGEDIYGNVMKAFSKQGTSGYTFSEKLPLDTDTDMLSFDFKAVSDTAIFDMRFYNESSKVYAKIVSDPGDKTFRMSTTQNGTENVQGRKRYELNRWYTMDVLFKDGTVTLYIDGEALGEALTPDFGKTLKYLYVGTRNIDLNSVTNSEYYIDNLKMCSMSKTDKFYGDVLQLSDNKILLSLSETLACDSADAKNIKLFNEETGEQLKLKSAEISGKKVIISTENNLSGGRYSIYLPEDYTSITNKKCYTDMFSFNVNTDKFNIDYNDEKVNPYTNDIVQFVASAKNGATTIQYEFTDRDSEKGDKALQLTATGGDAQTYIRYYPKEAEGESRNITFEFDTLLKQNDAFSFGIDVVAISGNNMYRGIFNGKSQFITFTNPKTSPDYKICNEVGYGTPSWGFMKTYSADEWHRIKIVFDRENKIGYVYFDNTLAGTYQSDNIADRIDRIAIYDYEQRTNSGITWGSIAGSKLLIDNIRFSYENKYDIEDVKFSANDIEYGPLHTITPKSFTVKIVPATEINASVPDGAIVAYAANGDEIKASNYKYENGVLTAEINNLAPSTTYQLTISDITDINGNILNTYTTSFKTAEINDYGCRFNSKEITKEGNLYKLTGHYKNQTRYPRSFVTVLCVYKNDKLIDLKIMPQYVPEWTEDYVISNIGIETSDENAEVCGFIWNNMNEMKPYDESCGKIK